MNMTVRMHMILATALVASALISPSMVQAALTPTNADARAAVVHNWLQYSHEKSWTNTLDETAPVMQELFHDGQLVGYVAMQTQGYVIIPAYTELPPITAYSGDSRFDVNDEGGFVAFVKEELAQKIAVAREVTAVAQVGPEMQAAREQVEKDRRLWTDYSGSYETFARAAAAETPARTLDEVSSVEPLLQSTWHQGAPFNAFCPLGSGGRTVVGCVATAAAQIVNFWRYPANGTGSHSYTWNGDNSCGANVGGGVLAADYSDANDWANMLNRYTGTETQVQKDAAAELNYEMGVAVNMDYGRCGSGASLQSAVNAFRTYYGMASDIDIEQRQAYTSAAAWFAMLQQELNAGHPMFYVIALHAIVCDGWRTSAGNQLHFNYGWSDSHTAWYTVDNLYCAWTGCNPMVEQTVRYIRPANGGGTPTPSLALTSPNGGETWAVGANMTVSWTSANLPETVNVQLNRSYPGGAWETIGAATANDGSHTWTVSGAASTAARIRVCGATTASVGDTSNAGFTIAAETPTARSITLTSPNGGETWMTGASSTITWSSVDMTGSVRIQLNRSYPTGTWETIIASTLDDGSHAYVVGGAVSSAARVRVMSALYPTVGDTSNATFTIAAPAPAARSITVTSPNGGESWTTGASSTITWSSSNLTGYVRIQLNRDYPAGTWETVISSTVNDGLHSFAVSGAAASAARVRVTSVSYPTVGDTSNAAFAITAALARALPLVYPNGGEILYINSSTVIRWTPNGVPGYVSLQVNRAYPSGTWESISSMTANDGSYTWRPTGAAASRCRIRVLSVSNPASGDTSNADFRLMGALAANAPVPMETKLDGAYPNPFNPTTTLRYQLAEAVSVRLDVYDVTGRLVATLADGVQAAGEYRASFDGAALGTGLYFVRFRAGTVNSVQKIQLLK